MDVERTNVSKTDVLFPPLPPRIKVEFSRPFWNIMSILGLYLTPNLDKRLHVEFKKIYPDDKIIFVDSATSGIYLILKELDVSKKDEIIIPSYVCKAVINAVLEAGATPVFVDISDDFNMDPKDIVKKITSKTRAIIAVHQYGKLCQIKEIRKICKNYNKKHKIILIEDTAVPIGIQSGDVQSGLFGDYSVFSFNMGKTIVSFGGGAVLSKSTFNLNNLNNISKKRGKHMLRRYLFFLTNIYYKKFFSMPFNLLRELGFAHREENIQQLYEKSNARPVKIVPTTMTRLQKAATLHQLRNIDIITKNLKRIAGIYDTLLKNIKEIRLPDSKFNQYTYYAIKISDGSDDSSRYELATFLSKVGIETQWTFYPLHLQSKYSRYYTKNDSLKNTNLLWKRELSLPIGPKMSEKKARFVANQISEFYICKHRIVRK